MTENIIAKIQKILAKTVEAGATEEEQDAALKMAERLMFKHSLTMQDVEDATPEREHVSEHAGEMAIWKFDLICRVADIFFCTAFYVPGMALEHGQRQVFVVGRREAVAITKTLTGHVAQQIESALMREHAKMGQCPRYATIAVQAYGRSQGSDLRMPITQDNDLEWDVARLQLIEHLKGDAGLVLIQALTGLTKSYASEVRPFIKRGELAPLVVRDVGLWKRSFTEGAVLKVAHRLLEIHKESVEDAGDAGTALVRNEQAALSRYMEDVGLDLTTESRGERQRDMTAFGAGVEEGGRIDVTPGNKVGKPVVGELDA